MSSSCTLFSALCLSLAGVLPLLDTLAESPKAGEDKKAAPEPKPGEVRQFEIVDGVNMKFCWIPAGKATLGSPKEEKERLSDEKEHEYVTKGFWLGKYLVTQAEWKAVMGTNPSWCQPDGKGQLQKDKILDTSRFPVERVSWDDSQMFLKKLNKRTGAEEVFGNTRRFVLPHEDDWEYACRGGKGNKQAYYFGNELNGSQANCNGNLPYGTNKKGDFKERTTEVGSYENDWPHPWGLCDMHGNLWQWCNNKYEHETENLITLFVLRGGPWDYGAWYCRSASRFYFLPSSGLMHIGFRVCLPL